MPKRLAKEPTLPIAYRLLSPLKQSAFDEDIVSIRNEWVHEGDVLKTIYTLYTNKGIYVI